MTISSTQIFASDPAQQFARLKSSGLEVLSKLQQSFSTFQSRHCASTTMRDIPKCVRIDARIELGGGGVKLQLASKTLDGDHASQERLGSLSQKLNEAVSNSENWNVLLGALERGEKTEESAKSKLESLVSQALCKTLQNESSGHIAKSVVLGGMIGSMAGLVTGAAAAGVGTGAGFGVGAAIGATLGFVFGALQRFKALVAIQECILQSSVNILVVQKPLDVAELEQRTNETVFTIADALGKITSGRQLSPPQKSELDSLNSLNVEDYTESTSAESRTLPNENVIQMSSPATTSRAGSGVALIDSKLGNEIYLEDRDSGIQKSKQISSSTTPISKKTQDLMAALERSQEYEYASAQAFPKQTPSNDSVVKDKPAAAEVSSMPEARVLRAHAPLVAQSSIEPHTIMSTLLQSMLKGEVQNDDFLEQMQPFLALGSSSFSNSASQEDASLAREAVLLAIMLSSSENTALSSDKEPLMNRELNDLDQNQQSLHHLLRQVPRRSPVVKQWFEAEFRSMTNLVFGSVNYNRQIKGADSSNPFIQNMQKKLGVLEGVVGISGVQRILENPILCFAIAKGDVQFKGHENTFARCLNDFRDWQAQARAHVQAGSFDQIKYTPFLAKLIQQRTLSDFSDIEHGAHCYRELKGLWQKLASLQVKPLEISECPHRFSDIHCNRETALRLPADFRSSEPSNRDFIHANTISGFSGLKAPIAAQCPPSTHIPEFLAAVTEEGVDLIVDLAGAELRQKEVVYYNNPGRYQSHANGMHAKVELLPQNQLDERWLSVTCSKSAQKESNSHHRLSGEHLWKRVKGAFASEVQTLKTGPSKQLQEKAKPHHVQVMRFDQWPDFGVADDEALLNLAVQVNEAQKDGRKVLVHCRAGVGRTGTLLTLVRTLQAIESCSARQQSQDIVREVINAALDGRSDRGSIAYIQTPEQLMLIHRCAAKYAERIQLPV